MLTQQELKDRIDAAIDWVAARTEVAPTTGPQGQTHRVAKVYPAFPLALYASGEASLCDRVRILGCANANIQNRSSLQRFPWWLQVTWATRFLTELEDQSDVYKSNLDLVMRGSAAWVEPDPPAYDIDRRRVTFWANDGSMAYVFYCTRRHYANGTATYQVQLMQRGKTLQGPVSLWCGYTKLADDVNSAPLRSVWYVNDAPKNSSQYYTRTMTVPAMSILEADDDFTYQQYGQELASFLTQFWADLNLSWTAPLFGKTSYGGGILGKSGTMPDDYMFSDDMWYDVNEDAGCPSGLPLGLPPENNFSGHFGTSKVKLSVLLWEHMTTRDPLYIIPTAVHLLNKYGDPSHEIAWPSIPEPVNVANVIEDLALVDVGMPLSPENVAKYIRDIFWDEKLGVRMFVPVQMPRGPRLPGTGRYVGDVISLLGVLAAGLPVIGDVVVDYLPWVASPSYTGPVYSATGQRPLRQGNSLRTEAFAVLTTLLGYKYGLDEWKPYADRCIEILALAQQGFPPYGKYEVYLDGFGRRRVVDWYGAPHGNWAVNRYGPGFAAAEVSPIRTMLFTPLNIVEDSVGTGGAVTEVVPPFAQALRVYLRYKHGVDYPTSVNLP